MSNAAEDYAPLHIDEGIEHTSEGRLLPWLRRWIPIIQMPHGWHSVRSQLRQRRRFPITQWRRLGVLDDAEKVSAIIAEVMDWPSANFTPEDRLDFVLMGYDEFAEEALAEICRKYALSLSADDYGAIQSGEWTVGMLVLSAVNANRRKDKGRGSV